jgi:hypothetical protein
MIDLTNKEFGRSSLKVSLELDNDGILYLINNNDKINFFESYLSAYRLINNHDPVWATENGRKELDNYIREGNFSSAYTSEDKRLSILEQNRESYIKMQIFVDSLILIKAIYESETKKRPSRYQEIVNDLYKRGIIDDMHNPAYVSKEELKDKNFVIKYLTRIFSPFKRIWTVSKNQLKSSYALDYSKMKDPIIENLKKIGASEDFNYIAQVALYSLIKNSHESHSGINFYYEASLSENEFIELKFYKPLVYVAPTATFDNIEDEDFTKEEDLFKKLIFFIQERFNFN